MSESSQYKIAAFARRNGWSPMEEAPDYASYERDGHTVSIAYAGGGIRVQRLFLDDRPFHSATRRAALHFLSKPRERQTGTCKHCLRPINQVKRRGELVWADQTNDPFYCPKALNFDHKPQQEGAPT